MKTENISLLKWELRYLRELALYLKVTTQRENFEIKVLTKEDFEFEEILKYSWDYEENYSDILNDNNFYDSYQYSESEYSDYEED